MKHMKKFIVAAMAVVTAVALCVPALAFAAGTGSITINPPAGADDKPITYKVYKVFDADGNGTAISYKLVPGKDTAPAGFTVDAAGNVTYATDPAPSELTQADIDAIAAYVTDDDLVATVTSTSGAAAVAANLPNGYYYITTTTGTLVTIDSTNPNATVNDKNEIPGPPDKKIVGASSYDEDGKKALAQVGTDVKYSVDIVKVKGATNYVFHDVMDSRLSYNNDVAVTPAGAVYDDTVESGDTITLTFDNEWLASLKDGTKITITYSAKITADALSDDPANNTATLDYGEGHTTNVGQTSVYNAKFTVTKQDGDKKPLSGAGFVIKNADGKYYKLDNGVVTWVEEANAEEHTSDAQGAVAPFTGLANGTYTLVEKTVPGGYNKAADSTFTVAEHDYTAANLEQTATVTNNAGAELPSTGGIGTTIFYIVGAVLVIGAGVVLITKRRVRKEDEQM